MTSQANFRTEVDNNNEDCSDLSNNGSGAPLSLHEVREEWAPARRTAGVPMPHRRPKSAHALLTTRAGSNSALVRLRLGVILNAWDAEVCPRAAVLHLGLLLYAALAVHYTHVRYPSALQT